MKNMVGGVFAHKQWQRLARLVTALAVLAGSLVGPGQPGPAQAAGVCDAPPAGVVCKNGTIAANETWLASNVYVVNGPLTVSGGITLTVQAGTVVKFYEAVTTNNLQEPHLLVHGSVVLQGQVTFTSIRDDAAGGDTNADGAGTLPGVGDWIGIYLEKFGADTGSLTGTGVLRYSRRGLNIFNSTSDGMTQGVSGWTFEKNTYGVLLSTAFSGTITTTVSANSFLQNTYGFGTEGPGTGQAFRLAE